MNRSHSLTPVLGFILCIGAVIGLVWGSYRFAGFNASGEGFLIQWIAIRSFLTDGQSPYSDLVTTHIQETVNHENGFILGKPPRYTSPLYAGIVVFPFSIIENHTLARALWLSTQFIAIFFIFLIALKLTGWKPAWYLFLVFSVLTAFSYHVLIPWLDGGLSIWASLFMVIALLAIRNNWNELGGVFLALSVIQPQLVILVVIFVLIWAVSQRKKFVLIWFIITLILLSIIGSILVPNWIMQYIRLLFNYPINFPPGNLSALFIGLWPGFGKQFGWLVTLLTGAILLVEWGLARKREFRWFLWTACLTLVIRQWIGIPTIPANFVSLILPLVLVSAMIIEHWPRGGQWVVVFVTLILFVWEWATVYLDVVNYHAGGFLNLLIPLPLILIIGLYWVRWWAIKPRRLLIEELRFSEIY